MRQIFQMSFPPPRDLVLYNINTTESIVITPQHLDKKQHLLAPTAFLLCHLIPTVLKKPDVSARGSWISIHNKMTRLPSRLPCNWPGHWSWLLTHWYHCPRTHGPGCFSPSRSYQYSAGSCSGQGIGSVG